MRRLEQLLKRRHWNLARDVSQGSTSKLIVRISELLSLVEQATTLGAVEAPATLSRLEERKSELDHLIRQAKAELLRLERHHETLRSQKVSLETTNEYRAVLEQLARCFENEVPALASEEERIKSRVARLSKLIAGTDDIEAESLPVAAPFAESFEKVIQGRKQAEDQLRQARTDYDRFRKLQEETETLVDQLRQVAAQILKGPSEPDICPLCHTTFASGQLASHIYGHSENSIAAIGIALYEKRQSAETVLSQMGESERAHLRLRAFLERQGLRTNTPIGVALRAAETLKEELALEKARLNAIQDQLQQLDEVDLGHSRYRRLLDQARTMGLSTHATSEQAIKEELLDTRRAHRRLQVNYRSLEAVATELSANMQKLLNCASAEVADLKLALAGLQEEKAGTQALTTKLKKIQTRLPWPRSGDLAELATALRVVRDLAYEIEKQLAEEAKQTDVQRSAAAKLAQVEDELSKLEPRLDRLRKAHATLTELVEKHSLPAAMTQALARHKLSIEAIFKRIHSPPEFAGLGAEVDSLVRTANGAQASLSEISTGQRAAFALSIFLAQNLQMKSGPPVLLIDDPIAHVDDLNSLSFLDYLRELAIKGRRQIFFATASSKVASLFEKKLEFFGSERFKKYELAR